MKSSRSDINLQFG